MVQISLIGRKGGVGKTTAALHLAAALAGRGARVLLLDDDPNQTVLNTTRGVDLGFQVMATADEYHDIREAADYVVVDSEAHPEPNVMRDLARTSRLLVAPTILEANSTRTIPLLLADLKSLGSTTPLAVLMTQIHPQARAGAEAFRVELGARGIDVIETPTRRYAAYPRAAQARTTVQHVEGGESAWADCLAVAADVLRRVEVKA